MIEVDPDMKVVKNGRRKSNRKVFEHIDSIMFMPDNNKKEETLRKDKKVVQDSARKNPYKGQTTGIELSVIDELDGKHAESNERSPESIIASIQSIRADKRH